MQCGQKIRNKSKGPFRELGDALRFLPGEAGRWEKVTWQPEQRSGRQAKEDSEWSRGYRAHALGLGETRGRGGCCDELQGPRCQGKEPFFHVEDDGRTIGGVRAWDSVT